MVKIGTFCKECIFNKGSCELGLHEKWRNLGNLKESDDGFVIDRICQWRRDSNWDKGDDPITKVNDEVHISGTIVIAFKEYDIENIRSKLEDLSGMWMLKHFNVVVSLPINSLPKETLSICKELMPDITVDVNVVINEFTLEDFSTEAFRKAKNGYVIFLDGTKEIDNTIIKRLDDAINNKLMQIVFVRPTDGYHQSTCLSALYKFLYGNKQKTVEEKIDIMAKDQNLSRLLVTWGEI